MSRVETVKFECVDLMIFVMQQVLELINRVVGVVDILMDAIKKVMSDTNQHSIIMK